MTIDDIKSSVNIFDLMDKLGISFRYRITSQILCPGHEEQNPSARVFADTHSIYCWVCGRSWDVVDLVMIRKHITKRQSMDWLAANFKITVKPVNATVVLAAKFNRKPTNVMDKKKAALLFVKYYENRVNISSMVWERIFFCWDVFERSVVNTYESCENWVKKSKSLLAYSFHMQENIEKYEKSEI